MTDLAFPGLDLRRPFTRADALAAGISPAMLRGSTYRRIFRNVYVHAAARTNPLVRVEAALMIHPPSAFASHVSAARLYRLPLPRIPEEHITVAAAADRRRRPGVVNHIAAAADTDVRNVEGMRASVPAQMFVELGGLLGLVDLVVVGDALVRMRILPVEALRDYCKRSQGRGAVEARRAAGYVQEKVDSPMETRLRMLIVLAGLPEPEVNHELYDEHGRLLFRLDLSYPERKLIVEYDGQQHRDDPDQWDHDIYRREWFDHNGWMIVPVISRGIYQYPDATINRVRAALKLRGCKNLPASPGESWRPYFPVKR